MERFMLQKPSHQVAYPRTPFSYYCKQALANADVYVRAFLEPSLVDNSPLAAIRNGQFWDFSMWFFYLNVKVNITRLKNWCTCWRYCFQWTGVVIVFIDEILIVKLRVILSSPESRININLSFFTYGFNYTVRKTVRKSVFAASPILSQLRKRF